MGVNNRTREYKCTKCHKPTPREQLVVKKIMFLGMGAGGRTMRTRVRDWLCPQCVTKDNDWRQPAGVGVEEKVLG